MNERRRFLISTATLGLTASGCATVGGINGTSAVPNSIAVLGVVQQKGLTVAVNEHRLATDLENLLRDNHQYAVMPVGEARLALGKDRHDLLLKRVSEQGGLDASDLTMLNRVNLPTRMAVMLTITGDDVEKLDPVEQPLRDNRGLRITDRTHVVLSTARSVSLSATLVDLGLGRVRMHNDFRYESVERKRYLKYHGSSLTGTVAARLANTVANGTRGPDWPAAPSLYQSFYELLTDVADELPVA